MTLIVLMFLGRTGPLTLGTALALREQRPPIPLRGGPADHRVAMAGEAEFLVCGLGRFGGALARELVDLGHEVLGVDADAKPVQDHAAILTHVVQADTTDPDAMQQIGAAEFKTAIVAIGTDMEASILTAALLVELGISRIVAKAITTPHGKILERVGAHRVVFPERDMGVRVAHTVTGRTIDYIQLDPGFALVETTAPKRDRRQDARGGGGPAPLWHHRRMRQAGRRLVHLRNPGHGRPVRATSSSSPARRSTPRPSASSAESSYRKDHSPVGTVLLSVTCSSKAPSGARSRL